MMTYRYLADLTLVTHLAYVLFVIAAVPLTLIGAHRGWDWVRNPWFRLIHLAMILVVVIEAWLGITCPLTTWEKDFRRAAGDATYQGDFIAAGMHDCLFFDASPAFFTIAYTLFALLVLITLTMVPIRFRKSERAGSPLDDSAD